MGTKANQNETNAQLPAPISMQPIVMNGQAYQILRYAEGKGPYPEQIKSIPETFESMDKVTITFEEARELIRNKESHAVLMNALKPEEWMYTEQRYATYFGFSSAGLFNYESRYNRRLNPAPMLILKEITAPAPTSTRTAKAGGMTLEILVYGGKEGPNLAQTKLIAKNSGKSMLTFNEASKIRKALKPGEWGYVGKLLVKPSADAIAADVFLSGPGWRRGVGVFGVNECFRQLD